MYADCGGYDGGVICCDCFGDLDPYHAAMTGQKVGCLLVHAILF